MQQTVRKRHFYPRSPRGERRTAPAEPAGPVQISIHAPREGSDGVCHPPSKTPGVISIHAPREGSDQPSPSTGSQRILFLSTLPARGATRSAAASMASFEISIHAPREGSDRARLAADPDELISIHAPREGSDAGVPGAGDARTEISIHAPREGSDGHPRRHQRGLCAISIHAPREGSDP